MKENNKLYILLFCVLVFSCKSDTINKEEDAYRVFEMGELGWKSKKITHFVNDLQYRATEIPKEYYILKNEENKTKFHIDSVSKKYENERIIEFEFEHINSDDLLKQEYTSLDYEKSVMYLASTIQKDFMAITSSKDTIVCSGVLFERHFKVSPFKRIILYFGGIHPEETIQLIYQDNLYNNGIFKFKFNEIPFKT